MNLDKYEKIDGGFVEAITLMRQGKKVAASNKREYVIRGNEKIYYLNRKLPIESVNSYNDFVNLTWYIPKPFDVRQAMLDRPNEWVGVVEDSTGCWYKVGFDTENFVPVGAPIEFDGVPKFPKFHGSECERATKGMLDACIPIEDVPEEANQ